MPIQFDPNLSGLIRNLVAQGVPAEAAAKAIEKYFADHPEKFKEMLEEATRKRPPWREQLASHGYSIREDKT